MSRFSLLGYPFSSWNYLSASQHGFEEIEAGVGGTH